MTIDQVHDQYPSRETKIIFDYDPALAAYDKRHTRA